MSQLTKSGKQLFVVMIIAVIIAVLEVVVTGHLMDVALGYLGYDIALWQGMIIVSTIRLVLMKPNISKETKQ